MPPSIALLEALKKDVVDSCQILFRANLWELFGDGHPSARIPESTKFIMPRHLHPMGTGMGGVKSGDELVMLDFESGRRVVGEHELMTETMIHTYIYKTRADAGGVVYSHPPICDAFAAINEPIPYYGEEIPIVDTKGAVMDKERAKLLVNALGNKNAILLRNPNSLVTVANTVRDATVMVYEIENTATRDLHALQLGKIMKGEKFKYESSYYLPNQTREPRYPNKGNYLQMESLDMEVIHFDWWRYLCEKYLLA